MKQRKAFLSYSWKDQVIAMRIYDDLTRSHIQVWRDQVDGDPTADFHEEFIKKIDECDDFIILDSPNYRYQSQWCLEELERCFENREYRNAPRIIVCLLEEDGSWRMNHFSTEKDQELFSKINLFKYIKFHYYPPYDNQSIYPKAICELCELFGEDYSPWNKIPESRDLIDEIAACERVITLDEKDLILNEYENIQRVIRLQKDAKEHYNLWIKYCKEAGLNLFFPTWTYAIWLAQEIHNSKYDQECSLLFCSLIHNFPNDPRGYRGMGAILAKMTKYDESEKYFKQALRLLDKPENVYHQGCSKYEVLTQLSHILLCVGKNEEAIDFLKQCHHYAINHQIKDLQMVLNYNYCLASLNQFEESLRFLRSISADYMLDSEYHQALGLTHAALGVLQEAYTSCKKAYQLHPSIKNAFILLCQKKALNKDVKNDVMIRDVLDREVFCDDENYWKGAICFHILEKEKEAQVYYKLSGVDEDEWYK